METYRLRSKLVESDREFIIQTCNDADGSAISSEVFINGKLAETIKHPHPLDIDPEETLSLVKATHGQKKKEIETLLEAYRRIIVNGEPDSLFHLGKAFYYKSFFKEARELFAATVAIKSDYHQAYNYLGMTELYLSNIDAAVRAASTSVEQRPSFADYRNANGEVLLAQGNFAKAQSEFEQALKLNLYYGDAYFNLGMTFVRQASRAEDQAVTGIMSKAVDCLKKASLINDDYDSIKLEEAIRDIRTGKPSVCYERLLNIREVRKEKHRYQFATFHMKFEMNPEWISQKVVDDRIKFLLDEVRKNPSYVDLYTELGRCYLEQSRIVWKKSIEHLQKAAELNPTLEDNQNLLQDAESEYVNICAVLSRVTEKG